VSLISTVALFRDPALAPSAEYTRKSLARCGELKGVAEKLIRDGWSVEWTITGLAFKPPFRHPYDSSPAAVRKLLDGLGIQEPFRSDSSRSVLEIMTNKVEYQDRDEYAEAQKGIRFIFEDECLSWDDREYLTDAMRIIVELEDFYSQQQLVTNNDLQRGIVKGRLQALEWLFGKEWPALDKDENEWEAEDAENDRYFDNMEQAIAGMQDMLFGDQDKKPPQTSESPATQQPPASTELSQPVAGAAFPRLSTGVAALTDEENPCELH
jgi:hypothetical protein